MQSGRERQATSCESTSAIRPLLCNTTAGKVTAAIDALPLAWMIVALILRAHVCVLCAGHQSSGGVLVNDDEGKVLKILEAEPFASKSRSGDQGGAAIDMNSDGE